MDERPPPQSTPIVEIHDRLPREVNYGHILAIVQGVQIDPMAGLLLGSHDDSGLAALLRTGTYAQILRALDAEIGQIMGRSEGAVKSLYHRTLLSLRDEIGDQIQFKGE